MTRSSIKQIGSKQPSKSSSKPISNPLGGLDGGDPLSLLTSSNDPLSVLAIGGNEATTPTKVK